MDIVIRVLQLLLSLSILVFIHELGHYSMARFFGARVEKFYLFFNPWFSIFKWKSKRSGTGLRPWLAPSRWLLPDSLV